MVLRCRFLSHGEKQNVVPMSLKLKYPLMGGEGTFLVGALRNTKEEQSEEGVELVCKSCTDLAQSHCNLLVCLWPTFSLCPHCGSVAHQPHGSPPCQLDLAFMRALGRSTTLLSYVAVRNTRKLNSMLCWAVGGVSQSVLTSICPIPEWRCLLYQWFHSAARDFVS